MREGVKQKNRKRERERERERERRERIWEKASEIYRHKENKG